MSINEQLKNIWVEKYRPSKLADMVLSDTLRSFVEECQRKQEIPNILLVGNAGTGKTTLAKVIINEILDAQYLYINASEKNGIDEVRTSILTFAQTKSLDGKIKIIFLDEFDNFTDAGQRALRKNMPVTPVLFSLVTIYTVLFSPFSLVVKFSLILLLLLVNTVNE